MEIKCCDCEHYKSDVIRMGRVTQFRPSKCFHESCFDDVEVKSPVFGTQTQYLRVSNYEIKNANNDCKSFEKKNS